MIRTLRRSRFAHRAVPGGVPHLLAVMGLLALTGTPGAAQAIRGVVVDDISLTPVPAALVRVIQDEGLVSAVQTGGDGSFFLAVPGREEFRLEVSGLGYETALSRPLVIQTGDTLSVEFRVRPDAVLLDPITVVGQSKRGRNVFERHRAEWDRGIFITPAMVDSVSPEYPAELLKGLPKVDVRWWWGTYSSGMSGPMPSIRTVMGRGCLMYMVDFVPVRPAPWEASPWEGYQLGSLAGDDIVAVEVYRSVLEVPPELRQHTDEFRQVWNPRTIGVTYKEQIHCGLVVFWTAAGW